MAQIIGSHPHPKYTFCPFHIFYHPNCTRRNNMPYTSHSLSQVKNASNSGKSTSTAHCNVFRGIHCAVCFSQQKHPEVTTFGKTKCAIQILNFTPFYTHIILNHQSKIIPNEQSAGFNYSEDLIPSRVVSSNSALNNVASEQLISIKAQVVNIAATKAVNTQYQGTLKKQEVLIRIKIHF